MSPGGTFERVYHALKVELGGDRFRPGDHLEPAMLGQELNASVTPVRDALHRLVGEGLVDSSDGFRVPLLTEMTLRHLYAWNQWLLLKGISGNAAEPSESMAIMPDGEAPLDQDRVFEAIAARSGNPEHLDALVRLNARLRPIRTAEAHILADVELELRFIDELSDHAPGLRRAIFQYHRRRLKAAPAIVAWLHERRT